MQYSLQVLLAICIVEVTLALSISMLEVEMIQLPIFSSQGSQPWLMPFVTWKSPGNEFPTSVWPLRRV